MGEEEQEDYIEDISAIELEDMENSRNETNDDHG